MILLSRALFFRGFFLFLHIIAYCVMKNSTTECQKVIYMMPSLRVNDANLESSFLQSNLEPIGGGDDPDIEW